MAKYIIKGGVKLKGNVRIAGNKNSILPCIAASLLTDKAVVLKNVPNITDVSVMLQILEELGINFERSDHKLTIQAQNIKTTKLPATLTSKLRASVLLAGPILAREGKVEFSHPGGDIIGKRSIQTHLVGFDKLGFKTEVLDRDYSTKKAKDIRETVTIFLEEASCTATENIILASVLGRSEVTIKNCAKEPQIIDLCNLLNLMGAKISGIGESTLKIGQVKQLKGVEFAVGADYIEWATYAIASAITQGNIVIDGNSLKNMEPVLIPLQKMGIILKEEGGVIKISVSKILPHPKLVTNIWPGFPTDLMSVFIVLATQAEGISLMHDWMYESRMFFVDKLILMGANITIADPHRVLVYGPTKLRSRELETPDIRAGMALVLASLMAEGKSVINRAELIERGYEDVVGKLQTLGAKIEKVA